MTDCKFNKLSPDKAYITNSLILPRKLIAESPVKRALELVYGETDIMDEMGNHLGTRPNILRLWDENEHHLIAPREFIPRKERYRFNFEFVDLSPRSFPRAEFEDRIQLRDADQDTAFRALLENHSGTLNLSCGKGKTVIALKAAAALRVPVIVIVNSTALLEQWKGEIRAHLGVEDVGVVQGDTFQWEDKSIVLAMVHTLSSRRGTWSRAFRRRFGVAVYDECFPAGTLVGGRPIETVREGDLVPSYDEQGGQVVYRRVVHTFKRRARTLVRVHAGGRSVVCTPNHPFLVGNRASKAWVRVGDLQNGDEVRAGQDEEDRVLEWVRVDRVEVLEQGRSRKSGDLCSGSLVYNLEVEDTHTYLADGFVVHNCHHMSAPVFVKSADLFYGRRYSLTATADRLDGLERVYQFHLGPIIHTNLSQQLIPKTVFHRLKWEMPIGDKNQVTDVSGEVNLSKVRMYLGTLHWRNHLIYKDLTADLTAGRTILVLTHSVKHVEVLQDYFSAAGAGAVTGRVDQEDRLTVLNGCNPVFGTFQLAREGLNKPSLDTLYVLTPFASKNDRQQAWGRIQRECPGKKFPLVRVYEDTAFNSSIRSCKALRRDLKNRGYPVDMKTIHVEEIE